MYRNISDVLEQWEDQNVKEPLLVTGARQVGKTWIIRVFCSRKYKDYIYLNFGSNPELASVFDVSLDPDMIIRHIGVLLGRAISPETAIFLDEIQKCERAITALKYFCESEKNYRIIGAGSLLGVKLHRFESSFPVGKVKIEHLYPMDFEEFLLAAGEEMLAEEIRMAYAGITPLPQALHEKALGLYHDYLFVGGMPRCVSDYVHKECDVMQFDRELQGNIILAYTADMSKYTTSAAEGVKIKAVYDSIPAQLARENPKFKYKSVRANANKRDFYLPLDWLIASGLVYRVTNVERPENPLKVYENSSIFKIYMSDAGLLCYAGNMQYINLLGTSDNIFKGAIAENYVIQSLKISRKELYYYKPDDSMEIDLLLESEDGLIPVEIKAGRHKRSTSLKNYQKKYNPARMIRISENNFGLSDGLVSIPLYAVFCITQTVV